MPDDISGVYNLPGIYLAEAGKTILSAQHNSPMEDIQAALRERLNRNGARPMTGLLRFADGVGQTAQAWHGIEGDYSVGRIGKIGESSVAAPWWYVVQRKDHDSYNSALGNPDHAWVRIKDRVAIGRDFVPDTGVEWFQVGAKSWLEGYVQATTSVAQLSVLHPFGYGGICSGTETRLNPLAQSEGSWAYGGFAIVNKSGNFSGYGALFETRRFGDAGWAHGFEADIIQRPPLTFGTGSTVVRLIQPNNPFWGYAADSGRFSIGRPDITDCEDVSVGLTLINNAGAARWGVAGRARIGFMIDQRAILGQDGSFAGNTEGDFLAMGRRHRMGWWPSISSTEPASYVTSSVSTLRGQAMEFVDGGTLFKRASPTGVFHAIIDDTGDSSTHPIRFAAGDASNPVKVYTGGTGNKSLRLSGLGSATIDLAAGAAGDVVGFRAFASPGHANFLQASANASGFAPALTVDGTDTNIDIAITPKGTGRIRIGTYTAGVTAITGSIEIRDAGGTLRKLAVIS
jgi:hypothetical protein